ncbi:hypothetical protein [Thiomonas sp.]|uniref:hypothetical protein n=1 Tax=Thiomonas sp. TaxID=2047785 RepID=UPI0026207BED|nr:hypothetical protein [Thiomonas sp.]
MTDTAAAYAARFAQLRTRFVRAHPWDWDGFIDWLLAQRPALRAASWRQYRAAVKAALEQAQELPDPQRQHLTAALDTPAPARPRLPLRTSARKARALRLADLDRLVDRLLVSPGRWDGLSARWLWWGLLTGLRPIEWRDARLQQAGSDGCLRVRNAKHSQGRAHGEWRTVHLTLQPEETSALVQFIAEVQADFPAAFTGCRMALYRAASRLWPRRQQRPSLYTGRHQFSANAKAAGLSPVQIAALMGHAVTATHQVHYGKRRSGHRDLLYAQPDAQDVARVRVSPPGAWAARRLSAETSPPEAGAVAPGLD